MWKNMWDKCMSYQLVSEHSNEIFISHRCRTHWVHRLILPDDLIYNLQLCTMILSRIWIPFNRTNRSMTRSKHFFSNLSFSDKMLVFIRICNFSLQCTLLQLLVCVCLSVCPVTSTQETLKMKRICMHFIRIILSFYAGRVAKKRIFVKSLWERSR